MSGWFWPSREYFGLHRYPHSFIASIALEWSFDLSFIPEFFCTIDLVAYPQRSQSTLPRQVSYTITDAYGVGNILVVGEEFPIHFRMWSLLS